MLLPAVALLLTIIILPFALSVFFSFTDQRLTPRPIPTRIVGVTNFARLFADSLFWKALGNTFLFTILVTPFQLAISLAVALILNATIPFRVFFRTVAIIPLLLPMTVVAAIWAVMYRIPNGPLNSVVQSFAGSSAYVDWLGSTSTAMLSIVLLSAWATFPYQMLIYLAGLQEIPKELHEAATLDGAKKWQRFRYVTWPGLRNVNIFQLIITTIGALKLFTQVDMLTKGGPNGTTTTVIHYMYQQGFLSQKVGYASAVAVFFFLVVSAIALLQRIALRNEEDA